MKSWLMGLRLLLALLCLGQAGAAWAAACSAVFPAAQTANSGATLDLSAVNWQNSPPIGNFSRVRDAGDHYFAGGSTPNGWSITAYGGASTRVFVNGSLTLGNNSELNAGGDPEDLIFVVNGSLTLGNNVQISGFVYVTGSIDYGNNLLLDGAITALGATDSPGGDSSLSYAGTALNLADSGDLCGWPALLSWSLNESGWSGAANEVLDASGNALHGRTFNGLSNSIGSPALPSVNGQGTCRYGEFNSGDSQYIQRNDSNSLDLDGRFTIAVWMRPRSRPSELMSILSKDENYEFHLKPDGRVNWWWQTSDFFPATHEFDSTASVPLDSWTHVAIRFAPGDQRIYINGVLAGSASFSGTPRSNSDPLQLGQDQGYAGRYFNGDLDELRIYSQALSAAQIQALAQERSPCAAGAIHHYEFSYASNALTCQPHSVTLKACTDAACSGQSASAANLTLSPSGWVGGDSVSFTGSGAFALAIRSAGTVDLGITSATPVASNPLQCRIDGGAVGSNCALSFADSGLAFDIPTLVAGKPQGGIQLRAVRKSDNGAECVPAFANVTRSVQFWSTYLDPGPAEQQGDVQVNLNSTAVSRSSATPTGLNLAFDGTGAATLEAQYAEAGQLQMNARYQGSVATADDALQMTGSDQFVSKPVGMCLATDTSSSCTAADTSCPPYPGARAGDSFSLRITPVAWQSVGDSNLCDNPATRNYRQSAIALGSQLLAPDPGDAGSLSPSSYDHALGGQNSVSLRQSEVGVFRLTATPATNAYFGETVAAAQMGLVGRFIPAYLGVSGSASLTPSCGTFSYQDQPMAFAAGAGPALIVTGYNRQGVPTKNYDRGAFWRLAIPARDAYLSVTTLPPLPPTPRDGRLQAQGVVNEAVEGIYTGAAGQVDDGARTYRWTNEQLLYGAVALPTMDDLPFQAAIRQGFSVLALTDADGACYLNGTAACQPYSFDFGGSQVRLGRLRLGNAHGSELQGLNLPLVIESWQGSAASGYFAKELQDNCSAPELNTPALVAGTFTGNLAAGETTPSLSAIALGEGQLQLNAPGAGNDGSVQATLSMPQWLWYDWSGSAARQAARGLATFGIYSGPQRLIFRRELYR